MATEDGNFFSRWSRRKAQLAVPPAPVAPAGGEPTAAHLAQVPAPELAQRMPGPVQSSAANAVAKPRPNDADTTVAPPPTLDDVASLTPESDFKPFLGQSVAPQVKNAAMKKLFTDPHFNVMDGLDIYIDDYSQPNPLPAEWLKKMVSAQFMKLVDEEVPVAVGEVPTPTTEPSAGSSAGPATAQPTATTALPDVPAASEAPAIHPPVQSTTSDSAHDHLDLQLQPDHAPRRGGPGSGAG